MQTRPPLPTHNPVPVLLAHHSLSFSVKLFIAHCIVIQLYSWQSALSPESKVSVCVCACVHASASSLASEPAALGVDCIARVFDFQLTNKK